MCEVRSAHEMDWRSAAPAGHLAVLARRSVGSPCLLHKSARKLRLLNMPSLAYEVIQMNDGALNIPMMFVGYSTGIDQGGVYVGGKNLPRKVKY